MTLASIMTWRSTETRMALRYCSTLRCSDGSARMTTTPDCGLTTTLLPSPLPIIDRSATDTSDQKSFCETIETRLASRLVVEIAFSPYAPNPGSIPGAPAGATPPEVVEPGPPPTLPDTAPEATRTSLRPERSPIR